jgi:hypothetical protein
MSEDRLPPELAYLKVMSTKELAEAIERTNKYVDRANAALGPYAPMQFSLIVTPGPPAPTPPKQGKLSTPRRRPPRRPRPRPGQRTPYQAKRAAMEDLEIRRLRRDGFTPYFGDKKRYLMTPPEFDLVLACESRQVAQVIHEVLKQSVGYTGDGEHGRREWVALSFRHFERRGLMNHQVAKLALDYAVERGYLLRQRRGRQRWEYAVHYRQVDNVPR